MRFHGSANIEGSQAKKLGQKTEKNNSFLFMQFQTALHFYS